MRTSPMIPQEIRRDLIERGIIARGPVLKSDAAHKRRIRKELRDLGVSRSALLRMEAHYLPHIIHPDERLGGVVYGHHHDGYAMLVATDRRIIFLDKKPLFVNEDEIKYDIVGGVSFGHAGYGSTVTLHTRMKDYAIRTLNQRCATTFVEYIESRCLERELEESAL